MNRITFQILSGFYTIDEGDDKGENKGEDNQKIETKISCFLCEKNILNVPPQYIVAVKDTERENHFFVCIDKNQYIYKEME